MVLKITVFLVAFAIIVLSSSLTFFSNKSMIISLYFLYPPHVESSNSLHFVIKIAEFFCMDIFSFPFFPQFFADCNRNE